MAADNPEAGTASGRISAHPSVGRSRSLIVWRFTDGKPGHQNQSAGLLAALQQCMPVDDYLLPAAGPFATLWAMLTRHLPAGSDLPAPDLLIGAGHATHLSLLAARCARGGRAVVLMKPSLPTSWFDLCVIPAHDNPRTADNILVTRGVLNRIRHGEQKDDGEGLILVGGPSPHVEWSGKAVVAQIGEVLARSPGMHWTLTTSRRTPATFLEQLDAENALLTVVSCAETGPDWLPDMLARVSRVWVTQDSVSMLYEALTSGAAVGLLTVPWRNARDRLARGVAQLVQDGLVTAVADWRQSGELPLPAAPFDEAARCADWIVGAWLSGSGATTQAKL